MLAGGVGGAKFGEGVRELLRRTGVADTAASLTIVANTGDDLWLAGVRITPDLDSIMYRLAGEADLERGWGRRGESERVSAELREWGVGWPWFTLGDLDLGAHLARAAWLRDGVPLHEIVARLTARWPIGARLLPATDAELETHVVTELGELHFQEWWTRYRAGVAAERFVQRGSTDAVPAPGVIDAITAADVVLVAPSNPVVSIGTMLGEFGMTGIRGLREALVAGPAPIIGVSPIIGGRVVRGMADACLGSLGVPTDAGAVGLHYGARSRGGVLDGWLVDDADAAALPALETAGIRAISRPLWMHDQAASADIADAAIRLGLG